MELSKIEKIDLREVWKHEASDFTTWLAEPENLELLSDVIGIDISLVEREASVGKFSVDILAEEENTGKKIIIENQLESSNHSHLGQIITYASGIDAEIVVWIVKSLRDEHRQAIDWLNERTDSKVNIFVLELEVLQISDSPFAPQFNIVARPNDWAKEVKLTDTMLLQLEFWKNFKEFAQEHNSKFKLRKAYPQQWYDISVGSSDAHISLTVNSRLSRIECHIYINESKELFSALHEQKDSIENELSERLEWDVLPNKKASKIKLSTEGDLSNQENWEQYHQWMFEKATKFYEVFGKYIKQCSN